MMAFLGGGERQEMEPSLALFASWLSLYEVLVLLCSAVAIMMINTHNFFLKPQAKIGPTLLPTLRAQSFPFHALTV